SPPPQAERKAPATHDANNDDTVATRILVKPVLRVVTCWLLRFACVLKAKPFTWVRPGRHKASWRSAKSRRAATTLSAFSRLSFSEVLRNAQDPCPEFYLPLQPTPGTLATVGHSLFPPVPRSVREQRAAPGYTTFRSAGSLALGARDRGARSHFPAL